MASQAERALNKFISAYQLEECDLVPVKAVYEGRTLFVLFEGGRWTMAETGIGASTSIEGCLCGYHVQAYTALRALVSLGVISDEVAKRFSKRMAATDKVQSLESDVRRMKELAKKHGYSCRKTRK
jgi:hypothetical protein